MHRHTSNTKSIGPLTPVCLVLFLAACASGLSIENPGQETAEAVELEFRPGRAFEHRLPLRISGGIPPYTRTLEGCPEWVSLFPDQGIVAGTAPEDTEGETFFCSYVVTDSDTVASPRTKSFPLRLAVGESVIPSLPEVSDQKFEIGVDRSVTLPPAKGGERPYTYSLACEGGGLPEGMAFDPASRELGGEPEVAFDASCTYTVTDSTQPPLTASSDFLVAIDPLDLGGWRFRTTGTVMPQGQCVMRAAGTHTAIAALPTAVVQRGEDGAPDRIHDAVYALPGVPATGPGLSFDPQTRELGYTQLAAPPLLGTPTTYRYLVGRRGADAHTADDALCLEIEYNDGATASCPANPDATPPLEADDFIHIELRVRNAVRDADTGEFTCPAATATSSATVRAGNSSNPVHSALAPVHGRLASASAHAAVRDRVRAWSPGAADAPVAIAPSIGFVSLSGLSGGFDYSGSSQSLSGGVELGAGAWQAGLLAAFTRTDLRYRADAALADQGYRAGEHDTEIFSIHPFAAWHAAAGGRFWASLGAGLGDLSHRDDLGFPSWSSSDVRLRTYAAGASVPLTQVLDGELAARAGVEAFDLEIEGGGRISSSLPTLSGRDWRAGLAWSAPVRGAPHLSLAYTRLTGDGPEGGRVEAQGSMSATGLLARRLTLRGSAGASIGVGDYDQDSWRLGGSIHVAPARHGRGFGLDLDTRLISPADPGSAPGIGLRGEAGYGLRSDYGLGVVRPYVGLLSQPGSGAVDRAVGVDLLDTPASHLSVEVYDRHGGTAPAARLSLRHRF